MKKIICTCLFITICLSINYAQNKTPKYLCQKWQVDTLALRETLLEEYNKTNSDNQNKQEMLLAFLGSMLQEFGQMWIEFHKDGTSTMHSPQETERGTWQYNAKTKVLSVFSPQKNDTSRFIIQTLTLKKMILQISKENQNDKTFKSMTFQAVKKL